MELIPTIRAQLGELDASRGSPMSSGRRAALWRAQHYAARIEHSLDDLRRYCLDALKPKLLEQQHENDYLRGYRAGFQAVLEEIRRIETRERT